MISYQYISQIDIFIIFGVRIKVNEVYKKPGNKRKICKKYPAAIRETEKECIVAIKARNTRKIMRKNNLRQSVKSSGCAFNKTKIMQTCTGNILFGSCKKNWRKIYEYKQQGKTFWF